jgi:hypothetical protein
MVPVWPPSPPHSPSDIIPIQFRFSSSRDEKSRSLYSETDGFNYFRGMKELDVALHAPELCQCLFQRNSVDIRHQYGEVVKGFY